MVLKGTTGFAFVRSHEQGGLHAMTVVPYGIRLFGDGLSLNWLVGPGDKVIGVGRLDGRDDALVVRSDWGTSVWAPKWMGTPTLLSIHENGTEFQDPSVGAWQLNTTNPRFRLLGVSDINGDRRDEMLFVSSNGLAVLENVGASGGGSEPLALRFHRPDGVPVSAEEVGTIPDRLVQIADFNKNGRSDLLFQHEHGITVLEKNDATSWTFDIMASRDYGSWIGGWNFGAGDRLLSLAGDFDGDRQNDFAITSGWGVGVLTMSGTELAGIGLAPYEALPITRSDRLIGVGKFDHPDQMGDTSRHRLLFKAPPPTAVLTANDESIPWGTQSNLTWSSANASSCTGTNFSTNGAPSGGPLTTGALYATTIFSIECTGEAGGSASDSVVVTVTPAPPPTPVPPPTVELRANPSSIQAGGSSTLEWSSTNANRCTGSPANFSTGGATAGSASVAPAATTTYSVTCTGAGGSANDSVRVTVSPGPCAPFKVEPGPFIDVQSSFWSSAPQATAGDRTVQRSATGLTAIGPTGRVFHQKAGGTGIVKFMFFGKDNNLLLLDQLVVGTSIDSFTSLIDFTTRPPTERPILQTTGSAQVPPPRISWSGGPNPSTSPSTGKAFLIVGSSGQNTSARIYRSDNGQLLCGGLPPFQATGETAGRATETEVFISYSTFNQRREHRCVISQCQ
jgi:hypothetical protein